MKELVKKILKSSSMGRKIYPRIQAVFRSHTTPAKRRRLQKYGFTVIQAIDDIATKHNILYFASYGTLLGLIRNGQFIAHDDDLDFGIVPGAWTPAQLLDIFLNSGKNFTFLRALEFRGKITEISLICHKVTIDFFFYEKDDNRTFVTSYYWDPGHPYPSDKENSVRFIYQANVCKLEKRVFGNASVSVPVNYEELLTSQYGANWRIPDPSWNNANHPGIVRQMDYGYSVGIERVYALEK